MAPSGYPARLSPDPGRLPFKSLSLSLWRLPEFVCWLTDYLPQEGRDPICVSTAGSLGLDSDLAQKVP